MDSAVGHVIHLLGAFILYFYLCTLDHHITGMTTSRSTFCFKAHTNILVY